MQSIEVSAKSLEEAKKSAAQKLGVEIDSVEVTVLEETKGLFGKTTVRVRASVIPAPTPAPVAHVPVVEPAPELVGAVSPAEVAEPAAKPKRTRGGRAPKEAKAAPAPASVEEESAVAPAEPVEEGETEVQATQEDAEKLAALLRDIVGSAELQVTVEATEVSGRYVNLQLDGKDVAYLVGKHGEVLNALQYLINIIGNRRIANGVRATLDGNDYRKRREDTLTTLAQNIAEQVKKRGEEAVLDALPAFERRIVHKALSTMTGITTYSEGEEPNRRVVIAPA